MSAEWEKIRLGNVASIAYGYTAKASWENVGPKFLRITDIQEGNVLWGRVPTIEINDKDFEKHRLQSGDIVFARTGATTGKSYKISTPPDAVPASYLIRLRLTDNDVLPEYVSYYFQTDAYWKVISLGTSGSAQGGFNASKLSNISIPKPALPEQKRIVAILDEAFAGIDAAIANTEKNLANARELFESYLNSVIGKLSLSCPEVGVDEACDSIIDCVNKTAPKVDYPTPYKMIRTTNVRNGQVNLGSVKYVEEAVYLQWTRRQIPQRGDVILTREAPMGEVGILDSDDSIFLGQRLVSYRADPEKLNNRFLLYCFLSNFIQEQIQKLGSGSTVLHMRVPDSKRLRIPLPDLSVQKDVVDTLDFLSDETCRLKGLAESKITALKELKQSLLQKAFTGELTAENMENEPREAVI